MVNWCILEGRHSDSPSWNIAWGVRVKVGGVHNPQWPSTPNSPSLPFWCSKSPILCPPWGCLCTSELAYQVYCVHVLVPRESSWKQAQAWGSSLLMQCPAYLVHFSYPLADLWKVAVQYRLSLLFHTLYDVLLCLIQGKVNKTLKLMCYHLYVNKTNKVGWEKFINLPFFCFFNQQTLQWVLI